MGFTRIGLALAASLFALPAAAQTFSFEFAFPYSGLPEIPGSELLASNEYVTTEVTVYSPTRLSLYRLRQSDSDSLLNFLPPGSDVDLVIGGNRFEVDDRAFDLTGDLLGTFWFSGGMKNNLGLTFEDGGEVTLYYADLPFEFYIDASATYDGIGPFVGHSDVIYFTMPGDSGLYRLQTAVPEPAAWGMLIGGVALAGGMLRRRRVPPRGQKPAPAA
ncbi:PEPxxWA-CTERM sorting domain-containing protein [Sphingomonas sp. RS6]